MTKRKLRPSDLNKIKQSNNMANHVEDEDDERTVKHVSEEEQPKKINL